MIVADAGVGDATDADRGTAEADPLTAAPLTVVAETPVPFVAAPPEPVAKFPLPGLASRAPVAPLPGIAPREGSCPAGVAPLCRASGGAMGSHAGSAGTWLLPERGSRTMALSREETGEIVALELRPPSDVFSEIGAENEEMIGERD